LSPVRQTVESIINLISINITHSIFIPEGFQFKNKLQLDHVVHLNWAEVEKVDIPVSVNSNKETDDSSSIKINPYRKVKGMGAHAIYIVLEMSQKCS